MKLTQIKIVNLIARQSLKKELVTFLRKLGVSGYTYFSVSGKGVQGLRKSKIGEARNVQFKILLEPLLALTLMQEIAEKYFETEKVIIFDQDIRVIRPQKFTRIHIRD